MDALEDVSRTFALSLKFLDTPVRTYISNAYLLCRIPDTIEDTDKLDPKEKSSLLQTFDDVINGAQPVEQFQKNVELTLEADEEEISSYNPDWDLVMDAEKALELFHSFDEEIQDAMRPWISELTNGMGQFINRYSKQNGVRIQTMDELEEYCFYVAGTVGHLILDTLSAHYDEETTEEMHDNAEKYGLYLQFVNICKDVYDDYVTENNVYLPEDVLEKYGVSQSSITDEDNAEGVGRTVIELTNKCDEDYAGPAKDCLNWIKEIGDNGAFVSLALPYLLAVATVRDLRANHDLAMEPEEVKISRDEVMSITSSLTSGPEYTLREYEDRINLGGFIDSEGD
jgi:farnesyl-diphosphate farnesyltransferase